MNNKYKFFNLTRYIVHTKVVICSLLFVTIFAESSQYQFNKIVELDYTQVESSNWQQVVTNPSNQQQHFIINQIGQMYLVDDMNDPEPILDLRVNQQTAPSPIKLTAIALHPNFSLRDQLGYGTFYTAHLETLNPKNTVKRLKENDSALPLKFDAVITEWQFSSGNYQRVDVKTKREVLRIAVPDSSMTINQMSFNPYVKSWNDDFGLLYIALNGQEKWQHPLYSGVILRINPAKFGLRNFTVPKNNPYINDNSIKNEIYLLGGQNIKQFTWPDKSKDDILLSHRYKNKSLLSYTAGRDDWREKAPKKILYQSDNLIKDVVTYHGRSLPSLRNRLVLLTQDEQHWLLESLTVKSALNQNPLDENKPQKEWRSTGQEFTSNSDIILTTNRDDEILFLDKTAGIMLQIAQDKPEMTMLTTEKAATTANQEGSESGFYVFFIVLLVLGIAFYLFKRNKFSAKSVVRKQFAKVELSDSQQQIALYHRHQKSIDTLIDIADLTSCEVVLNQHTISLINQEKGHGFNEQKAQDVRAIFVKEKVEKMIDGKTRQVNVVFTDMKGKRYTVCLYMRKGSDRITKKSYSVVIEDVLNWCWLIAEKINPDATQKRQEEPVISSESIDDAAVKSKKTTPLHNQVAAIRPVKQKDEKSNSAEQESPEEQSITAQANDSIEVVDHDQHSKAIDTELVNTLEKLVKLKQQGFLTQDEFTKAKKNLLKGLFEQ